MHMKESICIYQLWFTNIDAHFQQDIGHIRALQIQLCHG